MQYIPIISLPLTLLQEERVHQLELLGTQLAQDLLTQALDDPLLVLGARPHGFIDFFVHFYFSYI